jgi:hypothetical protein
MTTPPDEVADLFGLEPLPQASQPSESDLEAAEAALAAELASTIDADGVAGDAPDSRSDRRVTVSWPARMQLPDGQVIELTVRNVSQGGVGLTSAGQIPSLTVVAFEMDVPPLDEGGRTTPVKGTIKTTYAVDRGTGILCGGTWQAPPAGLEVVALWIERLWH